MTKEEQIRRLEQVDELLENVETFGWTDSDRDGPVASSDADAPKRVRQIVKGLLEDLRSR